ncbi:hypothetical protein CR513_22293, partial [Mucuna pruriens]
MRLFRYKVLEKSVPPLLSQCIYIHMPKASMLPDSMDKAICQRGPWFVAVTPCHQSEQVNGWPKGGEGPFFYLYNTLPLKLGVKLPFTHFERSVLYVLNVAPTQLHPNNLGKALSLSIFFWFFSLRGAEKVGWTSLSNCPKRKLLKSFLERYKTFKNCFL